MAYYQGFPYQYNPYQQIQAQMQAQPQIQNGGFVSVRSIEEAYNYPVAPGNSITFKDENSPYVYTKTRGFSQLDQPVFEKYRLVKEENQIQPQESAKQPQNGSKCEEEIKLLWSEVNALKTQINALKEVSADDEQLDK